MPLRSPNRALSTDPSAKLIRREWRRLTGGKAVRDAGRRTLVACSGGADSVALALALASRHIVIAHVVHDLRPAAQAHADRDIARQLAARLGVAFDERAVQVPRTGNLEASARRARYAALAEMAAAYACPFVAVAHQGDDLIETVLMRLIRGSAPRGLAALAETRPLTPAVTLIRPMLRLTRADSERLCALGGVTSATDATNTDTTRLRANLRRTITPLLRDLAPWLHTRLLSTTSLLRDAADIADARAGEILASAARVGDSIVFARGELRSAPALVIGLSLRQAAGLKRADRLTSRHLAPIIRAIQSSSTDPKHFSLASAQVEITAHEVAVSARPG
ncbi:MAG: tRNA lysidine(34) synthetase TilS [Phycisphaerales bacterium]